MKFNKGDRVIVTSKVSKHRGDLGKVIGYCKGKYPDMCRVEFPSGAVVNFYEDSLYLCSSKFNIGDVVQVIETGKVGTVVNYVIGKSSDVCIVYMTDSTLLHVCDNDLKLYEPEEIPSQRAIANCVSSHKRIGLLDKLVVWIVKKFIQRGLRKKFSDVEHYTIEEMLEKLKEGNLR